MRVKICGITRSDQVQFLDNLHGVDAIGFIFYPASKRIVTEILPNSRTSRIGVFVNATAEEIKDKLEQYALTMIQLHGDETPDFCAEIRRHAPVMKAIQIGKEFPVELVKNYEEAVDQFLFDTATQNYGGSGKKFNWDLLASYAGPLPFFLSGGIDSNDLEELKDFQHPYCIGVDLNSKFELTPGIKDLEKIKTFIKTLNHEHIPFTR